LQGPSEVRHLFSRGCCSVHAIHTASLWLDLAEGRLRLDRLCRNGDRSTFFPWASPIPREARKSLGRRPPLCFGPKTGAASIAFGLTDRHRGRDGRGLETARRSQMSNIGSFKKVGKEFQGEIATLELQSKNVRIVPETNRTSENAPTERVFIGRVEIGAAWPSKSGDGRSLKLDDPSFTAPIYANLVESEGDTYSLIWSRPDNKKNGE
jgi:uncharacterized protein (DUF736 family)